MRWYGVFILGLCVLAGGALPAAAQPTHGRLRAGGVQPLDEILEGIRQSRPGTFYDAEGPFEAPDGRLHYRLKWMTPEGRIIWLDTDARTGRVLGVDSGQRRPLWDRGQDYRERDDRGSQYRGGYEDRDDRAYRRDRHDDRDERRDRPRWGDYDRPNGGRGDYRGRGNFGDYGRGDKRRGPHGW